MTTIRGAIVISSIPTIDAEPYTAKLHEILRDGGIPHEFWGWDRGQGGGGAHPCGATRCTTKIVLRGSARSKLALVIGYLRWMHRLFWHALRVPGDSLFFCNRFDTALPVAAASVIRRRTFLFANRDNITLSYRWPASVKYALSVLERFVVRRAALHIVPSAARWPWGGHNLRVIPNTPSEAMLAKARAIAAGLPEIARAGELVLYVNGWLTETRGLPTLYEAVRSIRDENLVVLVAGKPACRAAAEMLRLRNVRYLGHLPTAEALAWYHRADLVFTYYDPAIAINRLAEPNKWGDCIATGTPFIVNSEVESALPFLRADACFARPYRDVDGLASLLSDLARERTLLLTVRDNLSRFRVEPWDTAIRGLLSELGLLPDCARSGG